MDDEIELMVEEGWEVIFRRVIKDDQPQVGIELRRGTVTLQGIGYNSRKLVSRMYSEAEEHTPRLREYR